LAAIEWAWEVQLSETGSTNRTETIIVKTLAWEWNVWW